MLLTKTLGTMASGINLLTCVVQRDFRKLSGLLTKWKGD